MIENGTADSAPPGAPGRRRVHPAVRWALTLVGSAAFGVVLAALLELPRPAGIRLVLVTMLFAAVSEAGQKWMDQLRARSMVLHGLVMFAGGVAFASAVFVVIGERPSLVVFLAGIPSAFTGSRRRKRGPDEDWIESTSGGSRHDGRRWRTGTP